MQQLTFATANLGRRSLQVIILFVPILEIFIARRRIPN
jgi:hypothetical protein